MIQRNIPESSISEQYDKSDDKSGTVSNNMKHSDSLWKKYDTNGKCWMYGCQVPVHMGAWDMGVWG